MSVRRRGGILAVAVVASTLLLGAWPASAKTAHYVVTVKGPTSHPFAGHPFHLSGRVTPSVPGEKVRLQRRTANGFRTVAVRALSPAGRYDFRVKATKVGGEVYRVEKPATDGLAVGDSASRPVFVTGSTLGSGRLLPSGGDLWSPRHRYHLVMRAGGNLVLLDRRKSAVVWSTHTAGHPGAKAAMRTDGDLVVHKGSRHLWTSRTATRHGAVLRVRDDGNVVVARLGKAVWARYGIALAPTFGARTMTRAQSWVKAHVSYTTSRSHKNKYGTYRRDCSGYVSMAWGLKSSYTTATLSRVAHVISKAHVRRGDLLLHRASGGGSGHAVLFDRWANRAHTSYVAYEETPGTGATHHTLPYPYFHGHGTYTPYRRNGT